MKLYCKNFGFDLNKSNHKQALIKIPVLTIDILNFHPIYKTK